MLTLQAFKAEYDKNVTDTITESFTAVPLGYQEYTKDGGPAGAEVKTNAWSSFKVMSNWADGQDLPLDEPALRFARTAYMLFYGLGFEATRNHIGYGSIQQILDWARSLGDSAATALAVAGAALLNAALTTALGDGAALVASTHPTAGTTQSNLVGAAALSPTTLAAMKLSMLQRVDFRGKRRPEVLQALITGATLEDKAQEIVGSNLAPYTTDNQINVRKGLRTITELYLTSQTAFFGIAANHRLMRYTGSPMGQHNYDMASRGGRVYGIKGDFLFDAQDWCGVAGCAGA